MSLIENKPESMDRVESRRLDSAWRLAVYTATTLIALSWTIAAGKDLNWDALNYHLYAGFNALHNRIDLDYFAAGPQSYLNPYAHVPLYLMVSAGWPSVAIASAFACLHAVNLWLSYELAATLNTRTNGSVSYGSALIGVALALLNPVFLQETGSTFVDISTGIPILGGWLLLANMYFKPTPAMLISSGVLLGAGAALKLSNAYYAIAALPVVLLVPKPIVWRAGAFFLLGFSSALGFVLVDGYWAWQMWKSFGNPLFPFFNQIFHSSFFTTEPIKDYRFLPNSFLEGLLRPFKMALPLPGIHVEIRAPDSRYAILALLFPGLLLLSWHKIRTLTLNKALLPANRFSENSNHALAGITTGFVTAWILWLGTSGNSRYFLPMSCVAGIVLASVLLRLFGSNRRLAAYAIAIVLAIQIFQLYAASRLRWGNGHWSGLWYQVSIPERFKSEPDLYFSTDSLSGSFFLPFLAPGSGMINSSGQYVLPGSGLGSQPIYRLIEKNSGHLRILTGIGSVRSDGSLMEHPADSLDPLVLRFGLRTAPSDCVIFSLVGGFPPMTIPTSSERHVNLLAAAAKGLSYFQSCRLIPADPDTVKLFSEEQQRIDLTFDNVEKACPQLFQPHHVMSQKWGTQWKRFYPSTGMQLSIWDGAITFADSFRKGDPISIGRENSWARSPQPMDCSKTQMPPFSTPSVAKAEQIQMPSKIGEDGQ